MDRTRETATSSWLGANIPRRRSSPAAGIAQSTMTDGRVAPMLLWMERASAGMRGKQAKTSSSLSSSQQSSGVITMRRPSCSERKIGCTGYGEVFDCGTQSTISPRLPLTSKPCLTRCMTRMCFLSTSVRRGFDKWKRPSPKALIWGVDLLGDS